MILRMLAVLLHAALCELDHNDRCMWEAENATLEDPWEGPAHRAWEEGAIKVRPRYSLVWIATAYNNMRSWEATQEVLKRHWSDR